VSDAASLVGRPRRRGLALLSYVLALIGLGLLIWLGAASVWTRYVDLAQARHLLSRMELAGRPLPAPGPEGGPALSGSPFLEGQTVTIAEAALQRRIGSAVAAAGGNVLSSQIEPQSETRKDYLTLVASCEIDQKSLQALLYDLEAGMPFLFIDQLVLQAPQALGAEEGGRLRLLISVSGRWQGTK
jgi:general secretion pathway protein M